MTSQPLSITRAALTVLGLLAGLCASAQAQYQCSQNSVTWTSSRPCLTAPRSELRALGNTQQTPTFNPSYIPSVGKAPDYLAYMSVECAQLNDAIRTGPARGLRAGPMSELQVDYRKRCSDDESAARCCASCTASASASRR